MSLDVLMHVDLVQEASHAIGAFLRMRTFLRTANDHSDMLLTFDSPPTGETI
jgi:hypothetical protein